MTAVAAPIIKIPAVWHHESRHVIYSLQPKQHQVFCLTPLYRLPHESYPTHIGCGGAAGGGKSYLSRTVLAGVALAWPGSTGIIFRSTEKEIKQNHVLKFLAEVPSVIGDEVLYKYNGEDMVINWENGSKTYFDTNTSNHHHFFVEGENEIRDIPTTDILIGKMAELPDGYEIARVDLMIRLKRKR